MLIDGKPGDCVAATDRGLLYGDGLFETLAVDGGKACLWRRHIARLEEGCHRLGITMPDRISLSDEAVQVIDGRDRGVLKIIVTRGSGGRGYRPDRTSAARRILQFFPFPDYPAHWPRDGVVARFCGTNLGNNPALAGIKHLNRLEQVLARAEWDSPEVAEGIMTDPEGRVVEGTMSNLFLVKAGELSTPPVDRCGVAGVMRALVLDLAQRVGIPASIREIRRTDVQDADGAFLTNSLIGIWPVRELDGRRYDITVVPPQLRDAVADHGFRAEHWDSREC